MVKLTKNWIIWIPHFFVICLLVKKYEKWQIDK